MERPEWAVGPAHLVRSVVATGSANLECRDVLLVEATMKTPSFECVTGICVTTPQLFPGPDPGPAPVLGREVAVSSTGCRPGVKSASNAFPGPSPARRVLGFSFSPCILIVNLTRGATALCLVSYFGGPAGNLFLLV